MHSNASIRLSTQSTPDTPDSDVLILDVSGHVLADKVRSRSDARLKTDVEDIRSGLSTITQLCGKSYQLKGQQNRSHGLIAQDVQGVLPSVVSTDLDGWLNISYIELIPFLIEAVKELDAKVVKLMDSLA